MTTTREHAGGIRHLALPIREFGSARAASPIEAALNDVPGVTHVHVNPRTEMVYVEYETLRCDERTLREAIDRAGYGEERPAQLQAVGSQRSSASSHRRTIAATLAFLGITGFFLVTEHRAHAFGVLPFLLILACPLLHLFMHRGHGRHGDQSNDGEPPAWRAGAHQPGHAPSGGSPQ